MFCKNCGSELNVNSVSCEKCGFQKGTGDRFCPNCGNELAPGATACGRCGYVTAPQQSYSEDERKSKLAAGLLGIFLGGLGVHNFYLGYTGKGVAQIVVSCVTCGTVGWIWGLIEGILIICGSINKDAKGVPLKD